jgi:hypothetical protein
MFGILPSPPMFIPCVPKRKCHVRLYWKVEKRCLGKVDRSYKDKSEYLCPREQKRCLGKVDRSYKDKSELSKRTKAVSRKIEM